MDRSIVEIEVENVFKIQLLIRDKGNKSLFQVIQCFASHFGLNQRYTHRVLQTIQIELILSCVWAEPAVLGSAKTTLKFKYEI